MEAFFTKVPNSYPEKERNPLTSLLRELRQIAGGKRNPWAYANRKGRTICAAAFDMFNRLILEFGRTTNTDFYYVRGASLILR